jgi:hypothetical protein
MMWEHTLYYEGSLVGSGMEDLFLIDEEEHLLLDVSSLAFKPYDI